MDLDIKAVTKVVWNWLVLSWARPINVDVTRVFCQPYLTTHRTVSKFTADCKKEFNPICPPTVFFSFSFFSFSAAKKRIKMILAFIEFYSLDLSWNGVRPELAGPGGPKLDPHLKRPFPITRQARFSNQIQIIQARYNGMSSSYTPEAPHIHYTSPSSMSTTQASSKPKISGPPQL